jgi:hypothetical protein
LELDGLLITGQGVHVSGPMGQVVIQHCTLVPGWTLEPECRPAQPDEPSLILENTTACMQIESSILGTILVISNEVCADPLQIHIADSLLDATGPHREALSAPECRHAHATVSIYRSTVVGEIHTQAIRIGENSTFDDRVHVARRGLGCLRFLRARNRPWRRGQLRARRLPRPVPASTGGQPAGTTGGIPTRRHGCRNQLHLGRHSGPSGDLGFEITFVPKGKAPAGRPIPRLPQGDRTVGDFLPDPEIRETALGAAVPDTTVRVKVTWQVSPLAKLEVGARPTCASVLTEFDESVGSAGSTARMAARTTSL